MNLKDIQQELIDEGLDGWLFYNFQNRDSIATRILGLDERKFFSRRWFYLIPAEGEPQKLVSMVEPKSLDSLPGKTNLYLSWVKQHELLKEILNRKNKIAMQYSPSNKIPYVSIVDAGTIELIKSWGVQVKTSAELIQKFEGIISEKDILSHKKAGKILHGITNAAFEEIGNKIRANISITERDVQVFMLEEFEKNNLTSEGMGPEVAVNEHASDPHFDPSIENFSIKKGDLILIDSWAKFKAKDSIYYDFTWMAYAGNEIPSRYQKIWDVIREARDSTVRFEREKIERGEICYGWEIDRFCRDLIGKKGYGEFFRHRTGHSIGRAVHGNAVNIDNLETRDERKVIPGILHSIEPGIYIPEQKIGVRSELDVFVNYKGEIEVTGPIQQDIIKIRC